MPMQNNEIANVFNQIAELLEIRGGKAANPFRIRAYRNAAITISHLPHSVAKMIDDGEDLTQLPGIGKDLAGKVEEMVKTGELKYLKKLQKGIAPGLVELLHLPSLGPKKVQILAKKLKVKDIKSLKEAARTHKIQRLSGFGEKTEKKILASITSYQTTERRIPWLDAEQIIAPYLDYLNKLKQIEKLTIAGSFRRCQEIVGDIDILVVSSDAKKVMDYFTTYEDIHNVIAAGESKSTVQLRSGLQVDLRVINKQSYGAALLYFTGSKNHNIELRKIALKKGYKINEYGVFRKKSKKPIAGKTEAEVYQCLHLKWIPPELRELRGEIEAAKKNKLPSLITLNDIRGDLHCHTKESDGHDTLNTMARAAKEHGYQYLAITDHSPHMGITKGLDKKRLIKQIRAIDRLNGKLKGITLLKGAEIDILKDGSLDEPEELLRELDITVCSVHGHFQLSRKQQTERILKAMDNPHFKILGHPTGRLINKRAPYNVDMEKILEGAKKRGVFVELDSQPDRLDLNDDYCKLAREIGVKVSIASDAHYKTNLDFMRLGVQQARRGWLEKKDVINTRTLKQLQKLLKR